MTDHDEIEVEDEVVLDMLFFDPEEIVIDVPRWYWHHEGHASVMTPWSTDIVYNKREHSRRPMKGKFTLGHYIEDRGTGEMHPELRPDLIAMKAWGEPRRYYRVVVTERLVEAWGYGTDADWVVEDSRTVIEA